LGREDLKHLASGSLTLQNLKNGLKTRRPTTPYSVLELLELVKPILRKSQPHYFEHLALITWDRSVVIDHIKAQSGTKAPVIGYIYFDYREKAQQTPIHVVTSLSRQIVSSHGSLLPATLSLSEQYTSGQGLLQWSDLADILVRLCSEEPGIYLILDALDECDTKVARRPLLALVDRIGRSGAKLFVTSRPFSVEINLSFIYHRRLAIEAGEADLRLLLEERISNAQHMSCLVLPQLKEEIISTILSRTKRM
jgi:hypothetical protein